MAAMPRPFKVWSCDRQMKKAVVVASFEELKLKGSEKLGYSASEELTIVLESDGTEVEDDLYLNTLENGTVLLILRPLEQWVPFSLQQQLNSNRYEVQIVDVSGIASAASISKYAPRKEIPIAPKPGPPHIIRPFASVSDKSQTSYDSPCSASLSSCKRQSSKKQHAPLMTEHDYYVECKKNRLTRLASENEAIASEDAIETEFLSIDSAATSGTLDYRGFWSFAATRHLIRLYMEFRPQFHSHLFKMTDIWKLVSRRMKSAGYNVSAELCDKKWRNLKITYRAILEKLKRGSLRTRKSWQYFGLMREALSDKFRVVIGDEISDQGNPPAWLAEYFHLKEERQARDLEEIQMVHRHSIEQLKKENESLHLLNDYLTSCSKK